MEKIIQHFELSAKPGEPLVVAGSTPPLSGSERRVLMGWYKGDVTVGEIIAHRATHGLPFGVLPGGLEDAPQDKPASAAFTPFDGPEAA